MRSLLLCALLLSPALALAEPVDLTAGEWGPMPSALAAVPDMAYRPTFVTDDRADTGWICPTSFVPVWLRLEWRFPVTISEMTFTQFPGAPQKPGGIGKYAVQMQVGRDWQQIAAGDASTAIGEPIRVAPVQPVRTAAIRLVIQSAAGDCVGISEIGVRGDRPVLPQQFFPQWTGRWTWVEASLLIAHREPIRRYLRRVFEVADPAQIKEAWLLGTALDRCTMWVNAHEALRDISYNGGTVRQAQVQPIPPAWLQPGENVVAARVDDVYEVGSQGLLAELILIGQDGSRTIIPTDAQWQGQADPGPTPDWQKPGYRDARQVAATVKQSANSLWHWIIAVPYPTVAPRDTVRVVALTAGGGQMPALLPGRPADVTVVLETATALPTDYAVCLRLGQESRWRNCDYELWGAVATPEQLQTSQWQPGRHEVKLRVDIPPEAPDPLPATLLVCTPQGAAGLQSSLPGTTCDAYGWHLKLPVDRATAAGYKPPPYKGFPQAELRMLDGNPTLTIDGQKTAPIIWSSSYGNYRRYAEYSSTGVKIFRPIIEGGPIPAPGEAEEYYRWWFGEVDRMVQAALAVDPQIKLMPALTMDPNPEWLFENPSEQFLSGRGTSIIPLLITVPERGQVRPTFMSQAWRKAGAEGLRRLVQHMRAQPYAPSILGLIFFAGRAGENYWGGNELNLFRNEKDEWDARPRAQWDQGDFSTAARRTFRDFLIAKYKTDAALQQAWQDPQVRLDDILEPARFERDKVCSVLTWADHKPEDGSLRDPLAPGVGTMPMDYFQCYSQAMQETFAAWGRAVKEASDHRLLTGCYYGYTLAQLFTSVPGFHGHTATDQAARTPDLDIYVSPAEYDNDRRAGGHLWGHNIPDSLRLHGKLFLYEADTRTYLSDIVPKQYSLAETLEVLKRDACAAMLRGSGWWWYEFADAQRWARAREWFMDPDLQALATQLKQLNEFSLTLPDRGPSAQIAIFYSGEAQTAQDIFSTLAVNVPIGRGTLINGVQRIGAPYDLYNLADLQDLQQSGKLAQYKLCLFLDPFYLQPADVKLLELAKGGGRTLVWLYAPGLAQAGKHLQPGNIAQTIGIPGVKLLKQDVLPTMRFTDASTPVTAGLAAGYELAPRAFLPGQTWERFGSTINPLPYLDPTQAGDAKIIGHWVMPGRDGAVGQVRPDLGAFAIRKLPTWTSVYSACPYLSIELLRNLAKMAGVHVYRDSNDILYADKHFVCVHTGAEPARDALRLPQATPVYDVFNAQVLSPQAGSIQLSIPPYTTALYYLGDPAKLQAAMR